MDQVLGRVRRTHTHTHTGTSLCVAPQRTGIADADGMAWYRAKTTTNLMTLPFRAVEKTYSKQQNMTDMTTFRVIWRFRGREKSTQTSYRGLAENSQSTHTDFTEDSQRTDRELTEDSQRTHTGLTEDLQPAHRDFAEDSQRTHKELTEV